MESRGESRMESRGIAGKEQKGEQGRAEGRAGEPLRPRVVHSVAIFHLLAFQSLNPLILQSH